MIPQDTILVSTDVTSLYKNIPQEEGIQTVCNAYENFYNNNPPIPSHYLKEMLGLIRRTPEGPIRCGFLDSGNELDTYDTHL